MANQNSASGICWHLGDLYAGVDDPQIDKDLKSAETRATSFGQKYRGKIAALDANGHALLAEAVTELESVAEQMDKPVIYAGLLHAGKTDDPKRGALLAKTHEARTAINQHLIFFELEWVRVADDTAKQLMGHESLAKFRHYLEKERVWKPHRLAEGEEIIMSDKGVTGRAAFVRLFDETVASLKFPYDDDEIGLEQILSKLHEPDRETRRKGAEGLTAGLKKNARLLTYIFNTLVLDHQTDGRIRKYPNAMAPRNLANEITPEVVEALMTSAERHQSLVERFYKLKAKLLKLDTLYDYDRYAPLFSDLPSCEWPRAKQIVHESYTAFSPKAGGIIREFFDKSWIDAELRDGKRGGAFSSSAVPSAHPYILVNFTEKLRDVMTLAHELGHGLHQYLSRKQGYLQCDTPLTTAETASVFGEMLTFQRLMEIYDEPRIRLALLCSKIEDAFATAFRQIVLTRFEQSAHKARKEQGELTPEQINELWMNANRPMHGDAVELTDNYAWWWLYIGHFIHAPFYCYAYAFGELLVLALYQKYKQEGEKFVPRYLEFLSAGGSDAPHLLLSKMDVDVTDPGFWDLGLRLLGDMVGEAERLAGEV